MILSPEILTILILDVVFLVFGFIAFLLSVRIYLRWDINSTTILQYKLEKQGYLSATIVKYIFILKLPLFLFFIFTLDKLSTIITGAMCAVGVVDATDYGMYLLVFKILNLYLFGFWLVIHYLDTKSQHLIYTRIKSIFFVSIFALLVVEIALEWLMFYSMDNKSIVDCCGVIYSSCSTTIIAKVLSIDSSILLSIFYANFLLIVIFFYTISKELFAVANLVFVVTSLITLISFFGTYIYELPTHHCPFCFLQRDYYYVGYLIYTLLFVGTFSGLVGGFVHDRYLVYKSFKISLIFNLLYLILVSSYPIVFYIKNGVWLY
jgi:hypothetical protein